MTQLSGKDLDIAVGLANGWTIKPDEFNSGRWILPDGSQGMLVDVYKPSVDTSQAIELIGSDSRVRSMAYDGWENWYAASDSHGRVAYGKSLCEAVCRLYVQQREPQ